MTSLKWVQLYQLLDTVPCQCQVTVVKHRMMTSCVTQMGQSPLAVKRSNVTLSVSVFRCNKGVGVSAVLSSLSLEVEESNSSQEWQTPWCGFKIVGNNIDKNVRPSHQRIDHQTQSLHYFHSFAVRDRVDLSAYSDQPPKIPPMIDATTITHNASDLARFQMECEILVSR